VSAPASPGKQQRLLIYGASGYTGRLLAAEARARGLDTVLAGRRRERLQPLAEALGLPFRVAPVKDRDALARAFADAAVVVNSAGPFDVTAGPVLAACLSAGAHYLDVAGELPVIQRLSRCSAEAEAAGVMVMPGAGFVYAASDCLAAHAVARAPHAKYLRLGFSRGDWISRGSLASMLQLAGDAVPIRRNGELCFVAPGRLQRAFDYGEGERISMAIPWPDAFSAFHTTGVPNIEAYLEAPLWMRSAYGMASALMAPLQASPARRALDALSALWPDGPSEAERAATPKVIVAEVEDPWRRIVSARLHTPNVYTFTQRCVIAIVERVFAGEARPGFRTPAEVFGPDFILGLPGVRREDAGQPRLPQ
jgi:short subunit dehydrogenase-like uncharacterized protein